MKSNKVRMLIADVDGIVLDEFNTEDDNALFYEIMRVSHVSSYLTPRVTDALEVALEEAEEKIIAEDEKRNEGYAPKVAERLALEEFDKVGE